MTQIEKIPISINLLSENILLSDNTKNSIEEINVLNKIFQIKFLSDDECTQIINVCEKFGFSKAGISLGNNYHIIDHTQRKNSRIVIDDKIFAEKLWDKIKKCVTEKNIYPEHYPIGINTRFRIYKYEETDYFNRHLDQSYYDNLNCFSLMSFIIYLNDDMEGGETCFDDLSIKPKTGNSIIFDHYLWHNSTIIKNGIKYALRTDIMFKNKELPNIGFGTFGQNTVEYTKFALATGYSYIDTAEIYENELQTRIIIDEQKNNIFSSTKIWTKCTFDEFINKLNTTPKFDLIMLHTPNDDIDVINKMWKELNDDKWKYKWQYKGVSNFNITELSILDPKPYCNQIEISPYNYDKNLIEYCKMNDIKIIAHSCTCEKKIFSDQNIINICENYENCSPINLIINWLVSKNITVVIGSENYEHIKQNIRYIDLDDDDINLLDSMDIGYKLYM